VSEKESKQEIIVSRQIISVPQRFATGPVMGYFLQELRDNARIMANRCPKCGRHQVPPREVCAVCRVEADQGDEVGPEGVIRHYDIVYYASPDPLTGETREVPYALAWIKLDGTQGDAYFWHMLKENDPTKIRKGLRVRAVFNEKRVGAPSDIRHFEIVETQESGGGK
jgi:uncharacterized OB-fold protein